jgi:hypothetical protein
MRFEMPFEKTMVRQDINFLECPIWFVCERQGNKIAGQDRKVGQKYIHKQEGYSFETLGNPQRGQTFFFVFLDAQNSK